jgi:hypothetical protein
MLTESSSKKKFDLPNETTIVRWKVSIDGSISFENHVGHPWNFFFQGEI